MKRAGVIVTLVVLIATSFAALTILPANVKATTLYVGGIGPGNHTTIQGAVDAANPGDTVFVYNGTYYEHIMMMKTLSLVGESPHNTTIDGNGTGTVVQADADFVNITGFAVRNGGHNPPDSGIKVSLGENCYIAGNFVSNSYEGIYLLQSAHTTVTGNNILSIDRHDIHLQSSFNVTVRGNNMSNGNYGIFLHYSDNAFINDNNVSNHSWAISLSYSDYAIIMGNNISESYRGIDIALSANTTVTANNVSGNVDAIYLHNVVGANTSGNNISNNTYGIYLWLCTNATIMGNTFSNGGIHLDGGLYESHTITADNLIDGLPIRYFKNCNDLIVDSIPVGQLLVAHCDNVRATNLTITNADVGFELAYVEGALIELSSIFSNGLAGIHVVHSSEITLVGNNVSSNYRRGIAIQLSDNLTIESNNISHNRWSGIQLNYSTHTTIGDNNISSNNLQGILLDTSKNITLTRNTITNDGVRLSGTVPLHYDTHTISQDNLVNGLPVHYYKRCSDLVVDGISLGQLLIANCTNVWVANLTVSYTDSAIELAFVDNIVVSQNNISSNYYHGIALAYCKNASIRRNELFSNSWFGINLHYSDNTTISHNTIMGDNASSNNMGIALWKSAHTAIERNILSLNRIRGISIHYSSHVTIRQNSISRNGAGINIGFTTTTFVHHNNFTDNRMQAYQHGGGGNYWDDGYPNGGNFWSDYAGMDQLSGPGQDQPGSDGIGDMPYAIDEDGQDNYPLMTALEDFAPPEIDFVLLNGKTSQTYILPDVRPLVLTAVVDDRNTGGLSIRGANYTVGIFNWSSSSPMYPSDDAFDSPLEVVYAELAPPKQAGTYDFCVYAWDYGGNFNTTSNACAQLVLLKRPSPPRMLDALLDGPQSENVIVSWSRSADDGTEEDDVVRYDVYRSTNHSGPYELVAGVSANDLLTYEWTCAGCGEGDSNSYFFYVEANDSLLSTPSPNKAGKFTRPLAQGPSLVSIPLIQSDESIEAVLQTVRYDKVWFYDSASEEWKWYMKSKSYRRGLWNVNHTMGLWVNVTGPSNLTVAGAVPAQITIRLYEGWNLVSFPSFNTTYSVADLKAETGVTRVEAYDPAPPHFLRVLGDPEMLQAGYGYWVRVQADIDWIIEVA